MDAVSNQCCKFSNFLRNIIKVALQIFQKSAV